METAKHRKNGQFTLPCGRIECFMLYNMLRFMMIGQMCRKLHP